MRPVPFGLMGPLEDVACVPVTSSRVTSTERDVRLAMRKFTGPAPKWLGDTARPRVVRAALTDSVDGGRCAFVACELPPPQPAAASALAMPAIRTKRRAVHMPQLLRAEP